VQSPTSLTLFDGNCSPCRPTNYKSSAGEVKVSGSTPTSPTSAGLTTTAAKQGQ
ncbi:unnamed protein product, partial [Amoebophrya sp. A25]